MESSGSSSVEKVEEKVDGEKPREDEQPEGPDVALKRPAAKKTKTKKKKEDDSEVTRLGKCKGNDDDDEDDADAEPAESYRGSRKRKKDNETKTRGKSKKDKDRKGSKGRRSGKKHADGTSSDESDHREPKGGRVTEDMLAQALQHAKDAQERAEGHNKVGFLVENS